MRPTSPTRVSLQVLRVFATIAVLFFVAGSLALGLALVNQLTVFLGGDSWWSDAPRALGIAFLAWLASLVCLAAAVIAPAIVRNSRARRP